VQAPTKRVDQHLDELVAGGDRPVAIVEADDRERLAVFVGVVAGSFFVASARLDFHAPGARRRLRVGAHGRRDLPGRRDVGLDLLVERPGDLGQFRRLDLAGRIDKRDVDRNSCCAHDKPP
jgi:hypothetical protein